MDGVEWLQEAPAQRQRRGATPVVASNGSNFIEQLAQLDAVQAEAIERHTLVLQPLRERYELEPLEVGQELRAVEAQHEAEFRELSVARQSVWVAFNAARIHKLISRLDCTSNTGWRRIFAFIAQTERTSVTSLASKGFLHAANAQPRSARFDLVRLGGLDSFSFSKVQAAHARFPRLHDVVVNVDAPALKPPFTTRSEAIVRHPLLQYRLSELSECTGITELSLASEWVAHFPASLCALTALKKLNLTSNHCSTLPHAMCELTNLTELILVGNRLPTLPESFVSLTRMKTLALDFNPLDTLPTSIIAMTRLMKLNLRNARLTILPDSIAALKALKSVNLDDNLLQTIPDGIGALTNLKTLSLANNRLGLIPDTIGELVMLNDLKLNRNQLTSLPASFAALISLKKLDLGTNSFASFPAPLTSLTSLVHLDLNSNQLTSLPASIAVLTKLNVLCLGGPQWAGFALNLQNSLTTLPAPILAWLHTIIDLHTSG
tara:strand:- start:3110 stop:4585 length:1476 start_codon:yes stop_codon:yes gene_type:complete